VNLTNGLVLHLRFDGDYLDTSGHGNDGAVGGGGSGTPPILPTGRIGQAVHIDNNDFLTVSDPNGDLTFDTLDNWSPSLWLRYTNDFNDLPIIGNAVNSTYQLGWTITEDQNKFEWSLVSTANSGTYVADPVGGPTIKDNNWHNMVATFDRVNGIANTYVDGKFIASKSLVGLGTLITGNAITMGQDPTTAYGVIGAFDVDDLGIWRRVLDRASSELVYFAGQGGRSFDSVGPAQVTLTIGVVGANLQIQWSQGTLQSATSAAGPYTTVAGAAAPSYTIPVPTTGAKYYRVKVQ